MRADEKLCPPNVVDAFNAYIQDGAPPSDFIRACLENNLCQAFARADEKNFEALPHIVAWLYWNMPFSLWGSADTVNKHLLAKMEERPQAQQANP